MPRLFSTLALMFCAVMTLLLLRVTYFPDGTFISSLPPEVVLKRFLEQEKSSSTWLMFRRDERIGPVTISWRNLQTEFKNYAAYRVHMSGSLIDGTIEQLPGVITWRCTFDLHEMSQFTHFKGQIRVVDDGRVLDFEWHDGDEMPSFELRQNDMLLMNDGVVGPLIAQMMASKRSEVESLEEVKWVKIQALEAPIRIGKQKHRGTMLNIDLLEQWKLKASFTEAGELALVELPNGFRILEQLVYNLAPDYDTEDEEEMND